MAYAHPGSLRLWLSRSLFGLIAVGLLLYPVDWAVWRLRVATGGGMGTVAVTALTAATLKGNRFEVYSADTTPVSCSRSLLPQAGAGACWWLQRHPQQITQY
jgi:hypothetical protein